ncbi:MAG: branched-chain-amino-acid transaminase [Elusimicrobiota bacterium]
MSENIIFIDGKWLKKSQAKISVYDHGLLYGDGIFEGIRAYNGSVFRLEKHLARLGRSAKMVSLKIPLSLSSLGNIVKLALKKNNLKDAYIRLLVTRGVGDLGLNPFVCKKPSIIVIADKLALFPKECYENGLSAIIAKTMRNIPQALDPRIKSMNYLNNIQAKIEAVRAGVPEAVMLNNQGNVSECTGDNIFIVKGNTITTPPVSAGVLEGITREVVMELITKKTGYKLLEKDFKSQVFFNCDEVFFTGTAAEVIPVTKIDNKKIGSGKPGMVTLGLIRLFREVIQKETLL